MKITYVGDGRCRSNWGARATSEALYDLLEKENEVTIIPSVAKLPGYAPVFYGPVVPDKYLRKFTTGRGKKILKSYDQLLHRLSFKTDYISEDVDQSIADFHKLRKLYPRLNDIFRKLNESDIVVLNGEGTMILSTPPRRWALFFLFIIKMSHQLGKKVYFFNAMISDCPKTGHNQKTAADMAHIFKLCEVITLRDKFSYDFLKQLAPNLPVKYVPDALFTWMDKYRDKRYLPDGGEYFSWQDFDRYQKSGYSFTNPYICVSGTSGVPKADYKKAVDSYSELVNELKNLGLNVYLVPTCSNDVFLKHVARNTNTMEVPLNAPILVGGAILANARAFVSGRFHPSILASLGGTPCVFFSSNSHKTKTLQAELGYEEVVEYNAIPTRQEIELVIGKVKQILLEADSRRIRILQQVSELSSEAKQVVDLIK